MLPPPPGPRALARGFSVTEALSSTRHQIADALETYREEYEGDEGDESDDESDEPPSPKTLSTS
jgi:hypothetical protein